MASTVGLVLVVDDDPDLRAALRDVLGDNGFLVAEASTGGQAKKLLAQHEPDLILLDLGLPDISGLDVLTELTASTSTPVIVLTARSGGTETAIGLDLGADDYIAKPFSERELIARLNAALRRARRTTPQPQTQFGSLVINENTHDVTVDGQWIEMTPKEFELLAFLARSPRQVYSRHQLLQHIWGSSSEWQDDNTVAEHIYRIRKKLDPDDRSRWIETLRGVGYRFAPPAE